MDDFLPVYIYIYIPCVLFLGFLGFFKQTKKYSILYSILIFLLSFLLLLIRDPYAPADAYNYASMFDSILDFSSVFSAYHGDFFFSFIQYVMYLLGVESTLYLIIQPVIFFLIMAVALKLVVDNDRQFLLSLSLFVITSTFILLSTNVMRQGLALSLLLLSIGLFFKKWNKTAYITLVLGVFSHFSAILIVLIIVVVRFRKSLKEKELKWILFIPVLPFFSVFILDAMSRLGGVFNKIISFSMIDYANDIVYIKVLILYFMALALLLFGRKYRGFKNKSFFFLYRVYVLIVAICFFSLPVLLISSRFIYYASGFIPVLLAFVFFQKKNPLNPYLRLASFFILAFLYAIFVFSFDSIALQLGL